MTTREKSEIRDEITTDQTFFVVFWGMVKRKIVSRAIAKTLDQNLFGELVVLAEDVDKAR